MNIVADQEMKPATPKEIVIEWIDSILERKNWSPTDLARKSGLAPSTLLRLLNDPNHSFVPTLRTLQKVAEGSGYAIPRKITEILGAPKMEKVGPSSEVRSVPAIAPGATVDLRYVSSLPASLQSATKAEGSAPAIPQLAGDETAFAFHMPDDSFDPWIKAGSLLYATKRRDPVSGDTVMITDKNEKTRVRLLTGIDEAGLRVAKTMPVAEEENIPFDDIKELAIVVVFFKI